ncbi:farnesylcysteine lyase [Acrasis kona]|uniref:Farnesylcysteine lyase n=1 Tax=Acrasis kona TaxID=1008807 RepID=A0AAW2Z5F4_9EUKA
MKFLSARCTAPLVLAGTLYYYVKEQGQTDNTPSIGIIGAGISGSSCSHYIRNNLNERGIKANIVVYEKNDRVGGRNFSNRSLNDGDKFDRSIEWGGSHVIEENKYAMDLVDEFQLRLNPGIENKSWLHFFTSLATNAIEVFLPSQNSTDDTLVVWDNKNNTAAFSESTSILVNLWNTVVSSNYGHYIFPSRKTKSVVNDAVQQFVKVYEMQKEGKTFDSPQELLKALDMDALLREDYYNYMVNRHGVHANYFRTFVEPIVRVNYMQDSSQISAFSGLIGSAGLVSKFHAIREGTQSFSEHMIKASDCTLQKGAAVQQIKKLANGKYEVSFRQENDYKTESFDFLILSAPLEQNKISFKNVEWSDLAWHATAADRKYVKGHTTIVTCKDLKSEVFGYQRSSRLYNSQLPQYVHTVLTTENSSGSKDAHPFNVLGYNGTTKKFSEEGHLVFKLFSHSELLQSDLTNYFESIKDISHVYWNNPGNYPLLAPNPKELPTILDKQKRLFYSNAMESVVSTMETSLIQSKNISIMVSQSIVNDQFKKQ